jgi:hypothetical protein
MRALRIIIKENDRFLVNIIDLEKVRNVIFTYPREDTALENATTNLPLEVNEYAGQKIEFEYGQDDILDIDLEATPAKFIIYDDYGNEIEKTDDLKTLENAIIACRSNQDPDFIDPDVPGMVHA